MDVKESIKNQTDVALGLSMHVLTIQPKDRNAVFSPLSVQVLLTLIAAGSKGTTLEQLLAFLKSKATEEICSFSSEIVSNILADGSANVGPCLSFASGAWIDKSLTFKTSFKKIADKFKEASNHVDFRIKVRRRNSLFSAFLLHACSCFTMLC